MKYICPLVVVEDLKRSRFLYEKIMGQKLKADFGENITFEGDFSLHQRSHFQKLINNKSVTTKSNSFELYFEDDQLEHTAYRLRKEGLEIDDICRITYLTADAVKAAVEHYSGG